MTRILGYILYFVFWNPPVDNKGSHERLLWKLSSIRDIIMGIRYFGFMLIVVCILVLIFNSSYEAWIGFKRILFVWLGNEVFIRVCNIDVDLE